MGENVFDYNVQFVHEIIKNLGHMSSIRIYQIFLKNIII